MGASIVAGDRHWVRLSKAAPGETSHALRRWRAGEAVQSRGERETAGRSAPRTPPTLPARPVRM